MLHPLAWRVISNSPLRCTKYESVFSLFELNSITLKKCFHPFMCRVPRYPAPLFKFWLHVSPKLAHRIIVVCHKTLCRYPLMREKCFGRCGGLALSRHSHLFPERPVFCIGKQLSAQPVFRSYHTASVAPRLRTPPPHPKTFHVLVSANSLPVLPVLTPFSLSRGDTLSPTGSHPVIQHVSRVRV